MEVRLASRSLASVFARVKADPSGADELGGGLPRDAERPMNTDKTEVAAVATAERDQRIGGRIWNPFWRNTITVRWPAPPLTDIDPFGLHEALDHLTAAVESGELRRSTWPEQIFANQQVFDKFITELAGYDQSFRIVDRWWCALSDLVGNIDEEGFIATQDIADEIQRTFDDLHEAQPQWTKPAKRVAARRRV